MKIYIDAMGGDNAPDAILAGTLEALGNHPNLSVVIGGPLEEIRGKLEALEGYAGVKDRVALDDAPEVITNHESPVMGVRKKTRSATVQGMLAVRDKTCDGFVSAGSTGAVLAGLMTVKPYCDAAISMDADLQDDINAVDAMLDKYDEGCNIVYGVRDNRETDTFFKRVTAEGFYRFMKLMGAEVIFNHADFRLMSKRALKAFSEYPERNLFLRGIVPLIGFQTDCVYYERLERVAGESKYPFKKMLALALDGITSFSVKPIQFITFLGVLIVILSFLALIYVLLSYFLNIFGTTVPGWASILLSIWFIGGVQLISIGLIGQYVGKIYVEVKQRPRYHIETFLGAGKDDLSE